MTWLYGVVGLVILQRLGELVLAARNTKRLKAEGAIEVGRRHYPLFILLHSTWLLAIILTTPAATPPHSFLLALFVLIEFGRIWVLMSLGRFFTTRVITLPGAALVRVGPYRFVNHPNYLVVIGEIACLPLIFGNWPVALIWSILNLALLNQRIRVENAALQPRRTA